MLRMYSRYAEKQGWRFEVLEASESGIGGFKEAIILIEGDKVYSKMKHESGVHRVQRVPQTEASGRIHTSAITVAVLPEAEEVDVRIDPKDLRIDTFCSSGPGGQSVNTTYAFAGAGGTKAARGGRQRAPFDGWLRRPLGKDPHV